MSEPSVIHSLFLVFCGAGLLATLALFARQALLLAYIAIGILVGPSALNLISNPALIAEMADVGILFLLFLLGLNLEPADLSKLFREAFVVTGISALAFATGGTLIAAAFGFNMIDSLLLGVAMTFSSTIIALKLLPTSALHHQRMGELIVSILLLQDMLAIAVLLALQGLGHQEGVLLDTLILLIGLPLLAWAAWWVAIHWVNRLFARFDQIPEYLFLLAIAWCLALAEASTALGLSHEIGAFIAGVTLATSPVARFIAESLKPLRDFFLVLFFVALGAGLDLAGLAAVALPALALASFATWVKPWVFQRLFEREQEKARMARETGVRLGQISEFSLLIGIVAVNLNVMSTQAGLLLQAATVMSFVMSSFWVVRRYPTPIATDQSLRRD